MSGCCCGSGLPCDVDFSELPETLVLTITTSGGTFPDGTYTVTHDPSTNSCGHDETASRVYFSECVPVPGFGDPSVCWTYFNVIVCCNAVGNHNEIEWFFMGHLLTGHDTDPCFATGHVIATSPGLDSSACNHVDFGCEVTFEADIIVSE